MAKKNNKGFASGIDQMLSNAEGKVDKSTQEMFSGQSKETEVSLNIKLPLSLRTKLKTYAAANNTSIKEVLIDLLVKKLFESSTFSEITIEGE